MPDKFSNKYRINTHRWREHNYKFGIYHVTLCTHSRQCSFGLIKEENASAQMIYNRLGEYVRQEIENTEKVRDGMHVSIPLYVVMPNHVHLVICIDDQQAEETTNQEFGFQSRNLASVIRGIKSKVTSFAHKNGFSDFSWQSGYYDRVVRNEKELNLVAEYIENNVEKWSLDKYCLDK